VSQPQNVPTKPVATQHYASPPRRDRTWNADRPGDVFADGQPEGDLIGSQGPDQGFAIKLARSFQDQLELTNNEHAADAIAGCVAVALKRASAFSRAPTVHDVRCAFTIFGYLGTAEPELVELRQKLFEEVAHPHHYNERRAIVDAVPTAFLRQHHKKILEEAADWRSVLQPPAH
jgi:hypothetical protein